MIIFDICSAITLGLGAGSAASHVQRHLKLRSAAASIDASPRLGPTCWPFEIATGTAQAYSAAARPAVTTAIAIA